MMLNYTIKNTHKKRITMMCPKCYKIVPIDFEKIGIKMAYDPSSNISIGQSLIDSPELIYNLLRIEHHCHRDDDFCDDDDQYMVQIDSNIAWPIAEFSRKGWYTLYCCGGHGDRPEAIPYVMFNIQKSEIGSKKHKTIKSAINAIYNEYTNRCAPDDIFLQMVENVNCAFDANVDGNYLMLNPDIVWWAISMNKDAGRTVLSWSDLLRRLADKLPNLNIDKL